jgi:hypothetical protein
MRDSCCLRQENYAILENAIISSRVVTPSGPDRLINKPGYVVAMKQMSGASPDMRELKFTKITLEERGFRTLLRALVTNSRDGRIPIVYFNAKARS